MVTIFVTAMTTRLFHRCAVKASFVVVSIFVSLLHSSIDCHPLCLDFSPPFAPVGGLDFCREYSELGCCSRADDARISSRYSTAVATVTNATCAAYLKTLMCIECSPLAVHLYDAETLQVKKPFPGLCRNYCGDIYRSCPDIVPLITNSSSVLNALRNGESSFCSAIAITDMSYCYPDVLTNQGFSSAEIHNYSNSEGCLCLKKFAGSLRNPLLLLSSNDGSGRIFVGEQLGLVTIYYKNGTRKNDLFLDISSIVLESPSPGDERGFLGMAFHPNFRLNQKFYVYFSIGQNGNFRNRVSEFTTSSTNRDTINKTSERVLLELDQPFSNHNGGQMLFGIDGYLYITTGDGGSGGDPFNNAQNLSTLLGKVLRIDVDSRGNGSSSYGIPPSNPFVSVPRARPEIFAYGCRNMWRCSVDEGDRQTGYGKGRIFCGDVGQARWEEVDIIKSGGNYGWNTREGSECYNSSPMCGRIGPEELPIYAYDHSVGNCIIGGYVYRGCNSPNFQGLYFFADYGYGKLFRLKEDQSTSGWEGKEIFTCGKDICSNGLTSDFERNILSFGEDEDGEVYLLTTSYPSSQGFYGSIYQLVDPRRRGDPSKCGATAGSATSTQGTTTQKSSSDASTMTTTTTTTTTTATSSSTSSPTSSTTTQTTTPTSWSSSSPTSSTTTHTTITAAGWSSSSESSPSSSSTTTTLESVMSTSTTDSSTSRRPRVTPPQSATSQPIPPLSSPSSPSSSSASSSSSLSSPSSSSSLSSSSSSSTTTTTGPIYSSSARTSNGIRTSASNAETGSTIDHVLANWNWSCDFEKIDGTRDFCNIVQATDDNFDWTIFSGPTPSDPTGPDYAYSGRWYIYIEASDPRKLNDTAKIYLPSPPTSGKFCLSFHYHMFGFHVRELQVFEETSGVHSTETIWRSTGQKGNFWLFAKLTVEIEANQEIGFIGVRGDEYSGDIALDAISLVSGDCPA